MKKSLLKKYAELIVRSGLAVKKGQTVCITANVEIEPFTALVVEECYRAGAKRVLIDWTSEACSRITYKKAKKEALAEVFAYEIEKEKWKNAVLPCFLYLESDDPDAMKGIDPQKMADDLGKNGQYIPGVRPGSETRDYVSKVLNRITVLGALLLTFIALLPYVTSNLTGLSQRAAVGGTGIIIVDGVAMDTINQLKSHLTSKQYKSFVGK